MKYNLLSFVFLLSFIEKGFSANYNESAIGQYKETWDIVITDDIFGPFMKTVDDSRNDSLVSSRRQSTDVVGGNLTVEMAQALLAAASRRQSTEVVDGDLTCDNSTVLSEQSRCQSTDVVGGNLTVEMAQALLAAVSRRQSTDVVGGNLTVETPQALLAAVSRRQSTEFVDGDLTCNNSTVLSEQSRRQSTVSQSMGILVEYLTYDTNAEEFTNDDRSTCSSIFFTRYEKNADEQEARCSSTSLPRYEKNTDEQKTSQIFSIRGDGTIDSQSYNNVRLMALPVACAFGEDETSIQNIPGFCA